MWLIPKAIAKKGTGKWSGIWFLAEGIAPSSPETLVLGDLPDLPGARRTRYGWMVSSNLMEPDEDVPTGLPRSEEVSTGLVLRPYQMEAVNFILQRPKGALLALSTGLGKSACALHAAHIARVQRLLVMAPKRARSTWTGEHADAVRYYKHRVLALDGRDADKLQVSNLLQASLVFCHYEIASAWWSTIQMAYKPEWVILDECHELREGLSKTRKAVAKAVAGVQHRVLLTATPIVNKTADLYSQLDLAEPRDWGHFISFAKRYCSAKQNEYGWELGADSNTLELAARLKHTVFRRTASEVAADLPVVVRSVARVPRDEGLVLPPPPHQAQPGAHLQWINDCLQVLSAAKRQAATREALDMARDHAKVVVFTWYQETAEAIHAVLHTSHTHGAHGALVVGPLHGTTTQKRRAQMLADFAGADKAIIVATLGTAGTSMNELVAASAALFVDLWWNPARLLQAEGRINRITQVAPTIFVRYLLAEDPLDEIMWKHLETKASTGNAIASGAARDLLCDLNGDKLDPQGMIDELIELMKGEIPCED